MTATERLRQLLDERGVVYSREGCETFFKNVHIWAINDKELCISISGLSPEQAVEATLGSWACKVEGSIDYGEFGCWQYDLSCGCRILWPDSEPPAFCPECGRRVEP